MVVTKKATLKKKIENRGPGCLVYIFVFCIELLGPDVKTMIMRLKRV